MNNIQSNLLLITHFNHLTQRQIAKKLGISLGSVNKEVQSLIKDKYLNTDGTLSIKAKNLLQKPKQAVILAAGYGQRMIPINMDKPKGLILVHKKALIERLIEQLQAKGINNIKIIVGYMKEAYEYLIDRYHVSLIVNSEYAYKNNLHSLRLAGNLENSYVVPCDIWCKENPFSEIEASSWYLLGDQKKVDSKMHVNKKLAIIETKKDGNIPYGIAYLNKEDGYQISYLLAEKDKIKGFENAFWEDILIKDGIYSIGAKIIACEDIFEINTFEDLRKADHESEHLNHEIINLLAHILKTNNESITDIELLKKGMTNRSFFFVANGIKYIMRIPAQGSGELVNRQQEALVYHIISGLGISDEPIYIDPNKGYKLTRFLPNTRSCNAYNDNDLSKCMYKLRYFHNLKLKTKHRFDLFKEIEQYEALMGYRSMYCDYHETKENILRLKPWIKKHKKEDILCHIDANPDNFLLQDNGQVYLIDWEYAGMQDPDLDIAMFAIYVNYDQKQVDHLLDIYYEGNCLAEIRIKVYAYMAIAGLLWSNWCEYKHTLGVDFGAYSLQQYRYAKTFYRLVLKEGNIEDED